MKKEYIVISYDLKNKTMRYCSAHDSFEDAEKSAYNFNKHPNFFGNICFFSVLPVSNPQELAFFEKEKANFLTQGARDIHPTPAQLKIIKKSFSRKVFSVFSVMRDGPWDLYSLSEYTHYLTEADAQRAAEEVFPRYGRKAIVQEVTLHQAVSSILPDALAKKIRQKIRDLKYPLNYAI